MVDDRKAFKKRGREQGDGMPVVVIIFGLLAGIIYLSTKAIFGWFYKIERGSVSSRISPPVHH